MFAQADILGYSKSFLYVVVSLPGQSDAAPAGQLYTSERVIASLPPGVPGILSIDSPVSWFSGGSLPHHASFSVQVY